MYMEKTKQIGSEGGLLNESAGTSPPIQQPLIDQLLQGHPHSC